MVICPSCGEQNFLSGERCWACGKLMQAPDAVDDADRAAPSPEPVAAPEANLEETAQPGPAVATVTPPPVSASLPEAPIPLAVLEARRRQAALDAMWQLQGARPRRTDAGSAPPAGGTTPGRPHNRLEDMPRPVWTAEEWQALAQAWVRKRLLWVVLGVIFVANVLDGEPGFQFPVWLLVIILGAAFARTRGRPR